MLGVLIILAIAAAVVLGYKTKINTGFFCIAFAYIIGCFMLGLIILSVCYSPALLMQMDLIQNLS